MTGQIDNQLFREWILSASSMYYPARRLEEMIMQSENMWPSLRGRHVRLLAKIRATAFSMNCCRIGMYASMYCSGRMGGDFAWENHGVPLFYFVKVFCLCSLPWIITSAALFNKIIQCLTHLLKSNQITILLIFHVFLPPVAVKWWKRIIDF